MKSITQILFSLFVLLMLIPTAAGMRVDHTFNVFVTRTDLNVVKVITVQSDGKYLVGGAFNSAGGATRANLARFNANGSIDNGFIPQIGGAQVNAIIVQEDGKILVGGNIQASMGSSSRFGILRLNSDGSLDPTFLNGSGIQGVETMAMQSDGKVLVGSVDGTINGVAIQGLARFNSDGSFDSTFNPPTSTTFSVIALPDGKIMACGAFSVPSPNGMMVRLNSDGSWDPSFSITSKYQISLLKLLSNGKILIGGKFDAINGTDRHEVARLNADGTLDKSFTSGIPANLFNPEPFDFAEQPDGKILVAGYFDATVVYNTLYRLNDDGSLDASFSTLTVGPPMQATAIQSSGQILVGGASPNGYFPYHNPLIRLNANGNIDTSFPASVGDTSFVGALGTSPDGKIYIGGAFVEVNGKLRKRIARLNPNGSIDPTFNPNAGTNGQIYDLAVQTDGKVVIAGDFGLVNESSRLRLARLNADGTVDLSFNVGQGVNNVINEIAIQSDGKIIIGGVFTAYNKIPRKFIARVNTDGTLDTTFDIGSPGLSNSVFDIVPLSDGKTLIGGAFSSIHGIQRGNIARLNPDGTLDSSFNVGGTGVGAPVNVVRSVSAILVQPDGKIVIGGGFFTYNNIPRNSLARLNSDGSLDTDFNPSTQSVAALELQPDGKILVGGGFTTINGIPLNHFARLNSDGSVDTNFDIGLGADQSIFRIIQQPNGNILIAGAFRKFDGRDHIGMVRFGKSPFVFDFDGDGKTDISIFRPSVGEWWYLRSSDDGNYAAQFGNSSDKLTPGDFTGDGKTDIAVWRPSTGEWFILRSEDGSYYSFPFGTTGDIPAVGDFDGDGKSDQAVFRPSDTNWYIRRSSDGGFTIQQFGATGDVPVVTDYDGDGKSDIAIFRPPLGEWWIQRSSAGIIAFQFGNSADKPVQGDYTGDGKADVAIWRPSTGEWFILRSEDFSYYSFPFGTNGDIPAPGDFDGDGKFDATVFRPTGSTWYVQRTTAGTLIQGFGQTGDRPVPNAFIP